MEALTKAGAFDSIFKDRKSIFESIPNLISKSKNIFENKSLNQIDLFANSEESNNSEVVDNFGEWSFQEKMAKEFETVGFFISDHPLNQYQDIFKEFNILSYKNIIKCPSFCKSLHLKLVNVFRIYSINKVI